MDIRFVRSNSDMTKYYNESTITNILILINTVMNIPLL